MNAKKILLGIGAVATLAAIAQRPLNRVDEVAWIVGDEAIFRSDIEEFYAQMRQEGAPVNGDPYCVIPERMALEKLFLHQAKIDTIEAPVSQMVAAVEKRINFFIANLGSREKVEEYFRKSLPALREQLRENMESQYIIEQVKNNLTKNVKATPSDVRRYFSSLPEDSIPYIPLQVEAQIITINPPIPQQEIEDIKSQLRNYTERVNSGQTDFSTLAIMYSEDGSAMHGGELGFHSRADFVPEFSNVAFNLNDPKKVSRIVETEYGFHIIQLIEKKGDQANVRHILRVPKVNPADLEHSRLRLDTLRSDILAEKIPFEEAARFISQDKDSRYNKGLMVNTLNGTPRFEMQELPVEVATRIEKMEPGEISEAFVMKSPQNNKDVVAIVKLANRIPGHRATLFDDYNTIKQLYEEHRKSELLKEWVENKIKDTYVRINDGWENCTFEFEGWTSQSDKKKD